MTPRRTFAWVSLSWLAACASSPLVAFPAEPLDALHAIDSMPIPSALGVVTADPPVHGIRVGDCAVYSVQLRTAGGVKCWFVRLTVAVHRATAEGWCSIKFDDGQGVNLRLTGLVRFQIHVCDADGTTIAASLSDAVPIEVLREGFVPACEFSRRHAQRTDEQRRHLLVTMPREQQRPVVLSLMTVETMMELVLDAKPLAPLLAEAVRRPSLLTILGNLGQGIMVSFDQRRSRPWSRPTLLPADAAYVFPLDVQAFGERALEASAVVVHTGEAMHVYAGVDSIAAVHPDDRDTQVRMRLQAIGRLEAGRLADVVLAGQRAEAASTSDH